MGKYFIFLFLGIYAVVFAQEETAVQPIDSAVTGEDPAAPDETEQVAEQVDTLTPLFMACAAGSTEQILVELKRGSEVNATREGISPLMLAVYAGSIDAVQTLVKAGADINYKNEEGVGPLLVAAYIGNSAMIKALLDLGLDPGDKSLASFIAALRESSEVASLLKPSYGSLDYRKLRRNEYKPGDGFSVFFNVSRIYVDEKKQYRASCLLMTTKNASPNQNYEFFIESKERFIFIEGDTIEAMVSFIALQNIVMSEIPYRMIEQALFKLDKIIDIW